MKKMSQGEMQGFKLAGIQVEIHNNDPRSLEKALRTFNKKAQDAGILKILKEKEFYEKPTQRRKREKQQAKSRWLKKLHLSKPQKA